MRYVLMIRGKWVPVTTAWNVFMGRGDIAASCEYIPQAVADCRPGVVL